MRNDAALQEMTTRLRRAWTLLSTNPRLFVIRIVAHLRYHWLIARLGKNGLRLLNATHERDSRAEERYGDWLDDTAIGHPVPSASGPRLSVLLPVYNPPADVFAATLESVLGQTYPHWELCIADDASTQPHVRATIERFATHDPRVRVVFREKSGHIAEATNSGLAIARGEFVVLLDHDDTLAPDALAAIAEVVAAEPLVDWIYTDEDKLSEEGRRIAPFFKPAWSPTLLLSCNYVTHLSAARRTLVEAIGGFHSSTVGSQDYDLFLRLAERARAVAHLPRQLYSWRIVAGSTAGVASAKPYTLIATERALGHAIARRRLAARLEPSHLNGLYVTRHRPPGRVAVSLVIVGQGEAWRAALRTAGIVISDLAHVPLAPDERLSYRADDPPRRAAIADLCGEYLVFLDAAAKPKARAIETLLAQLRYPQVGAVGGETFAVGSVAQAGVVIGSGGQPRHAYAGIATLPTRDFYLNLKDLAREVSATTLGASAIRRASWDELGGWRTDLPPDLAWVDLCLRLGEEAGYAVIFTPLARFDRRAALPALPCVAGVVWPWRDFADPFWNPNFDPDTADGLPYRRPTDTRARIRYRGPRGAFVSKPPADLR
jgi:GT2 family glycosyltransferase